MSALSGGGPTPSGFASEGLAATGEVLAAKRRRAVVREAPLLRAELGDAFPRWFVEYARAHPITSAHHTGDALGFIEWLHGRGQLTHRLYGETVRLRCEQRWPVAALWIPQARCLAVAIRAPGGRVRCFTLGGARS